jgi:hypothetical protein
VKQGQVKRQLNESIINSYHGSLKLKSFVI